MWFLGELMMIVQQPSDGPGRGWEDVGNGKMSAKMFRFLQRDINEGRIWYQHMGASKDADFFTFEVRISGISHSNLPLRALNSQPGGPGFNS